MFKQIFEIFKSDSLYEQALIECHEMLDIDLAMFKASIHSLRQSDSAEIDIDIYAMDKKINEFERDVRRKVMTHLAVGGKEDIGSGLVLVSVVIDIERIGDYTKNIYDLVVTHPKNGEILRFRIRQYSFQIPSIRTDTGIVKYQFATAIICDEFLPPITALSCVDNHLIQRITILINRGP